MITLVIIILLIVIILISVSRRRAMDEVHALRKETAHQAFSHDCTKRDYKILRDYHNSNADKIDLWRKLAAIAEQDADQLAALIEIHVAMLDEIAKAMKDELPSAVKEREALRLHAEALTARIYGQKPPATSPDAQTEPRAVNPAEGTTA